MLAPTSGARFFGGLVFLVFLDYLVFLVLLVLLVFLAQLRSPLTSNFSISPIMIIFAVTNFLHQDNELSEEATTEDFSVVQQEGQREVQRIDSDFDKILRGKR